MKYGTRYTPPYFPGHPSCTHLAMGPDYAEMRLARAQAELDAINARNADRQGGAQEPTGAAQAAVSLWTHIVGEHAKSDAPWPEGQWGRWEHVPLREEEVDPKTGREILPTSIAHFVSGQGGVFVPGARLTVEGATAPYEFFED